MKILAETSFITYDTRSTLPMLCVTHLLLVLFIHVESLSETHICHHLRRFFRSSARTRFLAKHCWLVRAIADLFIGIAQLDVFADGST